MFKDLPTAKKYIRYALWVIVGIPLVAMIIIHSLGRLEVVLGKMCVKEFLDLTRNGNCVDAFRYLRENAIREFKEVKEAALDDNHQIRYFSKCQESISIELKKHMTQGQITQLQPIDIFCCWSKRYDHLFKEKYEVSFRSVAKDTNYMYVIKDNNKVIANAIVRNKSYGAPKINRIHSLCKRIK